MPKRKSARLDDGLAMTQMTRQRVNRILAMLCDTYRVRPEELCTASRQRQVVEPRHLAMLLIRHEGNNLSYETIGKIFGRTHSTVYLSCVQAYNQLSIDAQLRERIQPILTELQIEIRHA